MYHPDKTAKPVKGFDPEARRSHVKGNNLRAFALRNHLRMVNRQSRSGVHVDAKFQPTLRRAQTQDRISARGSYKGLMAEHAAARDRLAGTVKQHQAHSHSGKVFTVKEHKRGKRAGYRKNGQLDKRSGLYSQLSGDMG